MDSAKHTRRRFLHSLAAAPAALWALARGEKVFSEPIGGPIAAASLPSSAKVVVAKRKAAADTGRKLNASEVADVLGNSIVAATGKSDPRGAWGSLFGKKDVVGIKVNSLAGSGLSSHPELVAAIVEGLATAGVAKENIIVWDRAEHELSAAGFSPNTVAGARVIGTDSRGAGYERDIEFSGEVGSCFSAILSRMCTAVINMPVLKDHDLSGVSLGMKNFYGAIHNPNKYHDDNCDPYIADLNQHSLIAKKLRLVICDGLKGQYHGGPASREQWAWPAGTLLVGTDPVAVDRIGLDLIEEKRKEVGMDSLKDVGREAKHIQTAAERGLGVSDIAKISKITVS
jgi:uncharacterized protein (DUF362 family)